MVYGLWVWAHTDLTDLTVFARLVENLTDDSWALLQWVKEKKSENSEAQSSPISVWLRGWDLCEGAGFCPISNPLKSNL